jgi:hypothetical protein
VFLTCCWSCDDYIKLLAICNMLLLLFYRKLCTSKYFNSACTDDNFTFSLPLYLQHGPILLCILVAQVATAVATYFFR